MATAIGGQALAAVSDGEDRAKLAAAHDKYGRGKKIPRNSVKDRKLRSKLQSLEDKYKTAVLQAKDAEILLENQSGFLEPETELERSYKIRQDEIVRNVSVQTAKNAFSLQLTELGPYAADYTRNGKSLLLTGKKGHVATTQWRDGKLGCELQLGESIRAARWLHNDQYFAVSQKKHVYIYDHVGVELQCLDKHIEVTHMEFLPYHFLLSTIGNAGYIKWTDTSTWKTISETPTRLGTPVSMTQNPHNAILHVGHQNGTVTLWSPNSTAPLAKLLAHRGPVRALAIDRAGRYMVSAGQDMRLAVWDIRMFKEVNNYALRQPGSSLAVSDTGLVSAGWGTSVSIWRDMLSSSKASPYMTWGGEGKRIESLRFCPFEDVLGIGHSGGFSSIIIPGAGEANFDALELNPYESVKQRQETEVKGLLNKLRPEMISLNPDFIGGLDSASETTKRLERDLDRKDEDEIEKMKKKGRGKNSSLRKYLRKRRTKNIIDEKRLRVEAIRKRMLQQQQPENEHDMGTALLRLRKKSTR